MTASSRSVDSLGRAACGIKYESQAPGSTVRLREDIGASLDDEACGKHVLLSAGGYEFLRKFSDYFAVKPEHCFAVVQWERVVPSKQKSPGARTRLLGGGRGILERVHLAGEPTNLNVESGAPLNEHPIVLFDIRLPVERHLMPDLGRTARHGLLDPLLCRQSTGLSWITRLHAFSPF